MLKFFYGDWMFLVPVIFVVLLFAYIIIGTVINYKENKPVEQNIEKFIETERGVTLHLLPEDSYEK